MSALIQPSPKQLEALKARIIAEHGEEYYYSLISSPRVFRRTYERDFTGFTHDCFTWKPGQAPTKYQDDLTGLIGEGGKLAIQSLHGVGKTTLLAWLVLWYALTRDTEDWKLITTASAWRQLQHYLWPEVHKWARVLKWGKLGRPAFNERSELHKLELQLGTGSATAVASNNPGYIEGAHADRMSFVYDESKLVSAATFDASNGAFAGAGKDTGREAIAVAASTPGEPQGRFYEICARAPGLRSWRVYRVRLEDAVRAGRVSNEWVEEMRALWGEQSPLFQNKVLGEFAAQGANNVIPLAWVEEANLRYDDYCRRTESGLFTPEVDPELLLALSLRSIGADIADGGGAETVLAPLYVSPEVEIIANLDGWVALPKDQVNTARKLKGILDAHKETRHEDCAAIIDTNGTGGGVYSILNDEGYPAISFVGGEGTDITDGSGKVGFRNLRTLAYWHLREKLNPERPGGSKVALPRHPKLTRDLTLPRYKEVAGGKYALESKEDIAKRNDGESTDYGDAVTQAFLYDVLERRRAMAW